MTNDIAKARRILVVTKFRYLGDSIITTPFLRQLHNAAPHADVTLLSGPQIPQLLLRCPHLSDIWTFDRSSDKTRQLVSRIRDSEFEMCFLLNRSLHSSYVAYAARIPHRVGFNTESRGPLLTVRVPYDKNRSEIDCCVDLLRAVGIEGSYALPELWVTAAERLAAEQFIRRAGYDGSAPLILVQPGAKDTYRKQWPAERFADVIDSLQESGTERAIALIGSEEERPACEEVLLRAHKPVVNLVGQTTLREILALLSIADLLIANDTAMVHAAAAVGTSTVAVHGPQSAVKWAYGPPCHRAVVGESTSTKPDRHANRRALHTIPAEAVISAATELLSESPTPIIEDTN